MKRSQATRNREIGLVSHRRWFGKGLYRLRGCSDGYAPERPMPTSDAKLFAWLLAPETAHRRFAPAAVRVRVR